jgi:hypothetical protein
MKNGYIMGMVAGAIAGFVDNIASVLAMYLAEIIGLWDPKVTYDVSLWIDRFSSHLALNIIWGMFFGVIYAMIYDRIPSKGIKKGLIFGILFYWLLSCVRISSFLQSYGELWSGILWAKAFSWTGFFASIAFGLVLGYLYKPKK